jgi:hypothetical protein
MKILSAALAIALVATPIGGFTARGPSHSRQFALAATPDSAASVSDYLSKAHEEKLRAVRDVENKKNLEIAVSISWNQLGVPRLSKHTKECVWLN